MSASGRSRVPWGPGGCAGAGPRLAGCRMRSGSGRALPQRHVRPLCCDPPRPCCCAAPLGVPRWHRHLPYLSPGPGAPSLTVPAGTAACPQPHSPAGDLPSLPADTTAFAFLHPHGGTHGPEPLGCSWDGAGPGDVARAPLRVPRPPPKVPKSPEFSPKWAPTAFKKPEPRGAAAPRCDPALQ